MSSVKPRYDGGGSEFGRVHRFLPISCGMFDIDRMSAQLTVDLELRNGDVGFIEYNTDFDNAEVIFRALIEIKHRDSDRVREAMRCKVGTSTFAQKKMAEKLGARYFFVIADNGKQPFSFYEMVGDEFQHIGTLAYTEDNVKDEINRFWAKIGLLKKVRKAA